VVEARHGNDAIHHCESKEVRFDLLVTDVMMPDLSGTDLSRRILALQPHIKILFTSGYTDQAIAPQGVAEGDGIFLQKPFTPETLLHKVREVLDGPRAEAA
jgi:CheY-like chemotaxis protein